MLTLKYKGRRFSSARSLAGALERDIKAAFEKEVRRTAGASGLIVRKTTKGLEVTGDATKVRRFTDRLGR